MSAPVHLRFFDFGLEDLNPIEAGESVNFPDRHVVPISFNAVIIHHVRHGHGIFYSRDKEYRVGPGQAFIILPGEERSVHYKADHNDPWEYAWISFTGKLSPAFSVLPPVFDLPKNSFPNLYGLKNADDSVALLLAADLLTLYAKLLKPKLEERDFVRLIKEHIRKNYMQKLSIENFAQRFNMDRRYLSQQFKAQTGLSTRAYLTKVRMEKAAEFLRKGYSTRDTAVLCGFPGTSNFHKMFTNHYGMTPIAWKNKNSED